ncbi:MAG: nuclear transport factor 2 family protein [Balneolaceae bacterium]|nr:nuclear transport factor 2 family protein [Balneolaceae bacterium]MBO6545089.1 nuclear transport factor 2 family protein [Balneolaceae bacterium]MBO6646485.1 nuclear transport factor 2 family protein [Balneolaceae bacterium]
MKKSILLLLTVCISTAALAQSETELITETINDYIEGTSYGNQDQVRKAFHPDLNLYSIRNGKLHVWFGQDYINGITEGRNTGRTGKILSIDYENNVATAKAEIIIPGRPAPFIDYFILAKAEGKWTIIHKAYTVKTSSD